MYKKTNPIILKATYILAVQMLMVGGGYRLSNLWMATAVNKEVKKKLQHRCL